MASAMMIQSSAALGSASVRASSSARSHVSASTSGVFFWSLYYLLLVKRLYWSALYSGFTTAISRSEGEHCFIAKCLFGLPGVTEPDYCCVLLCMLALCISRCSLRALHGLCTVR